MASPGIFHLFVYGSLRSGFRSPAYEYISRYFSFAGNAKVKGKLYDLGAYPAAIPFDGEVYITGELYKVKDEAEFSWAIGQLDDYEGISVEQGETAMYRRDLVEVFSNDEKVKAWIYWYSGDVAGYPLIESGDIVQYMESRK